MLGRGTETGRADKYDRSMCLPGQVSTCRNITFGDVRTPDIPSLAVLCKPSPAVFIYYTQGPIHFYRYSPDIHRDYSSIEMMCESGNHFDLNRKCNWTRWSTMKFRRYNNLRNDLSNDIKG